MNQSNRYSKRLSLLFLVITMVWGCGSGGVLQSTGNQSDRIKDDTGSTILGGPIYVDEFVNNAKEYENQLVTIRGVFMGWKGNCKVPPP